MAAATIAGLATAAILHFAFAADSTLPAPKFNLEKTPISRASGFSSYAPVIKKVAPSVVNIYSTRVLRMQPMSDPFHRFLWGDDNPHPRMYREEGLGSGVIVSADGYILTASHVIEGADEVKVSLADGAKQLSVKVVGSDPATDVAVLKVDAKNLPAITLADSDQLEVGDVVLAIGNPFEVGQTVTMGIISGLGRRGVGINEYENFIQTDAAINPGNSGGALVDAEGRLVGINTAIISRSGGNQGIGFAVPANLARVMMERIIKDGKVTRGYLGVDIQPLNSDLAKEFNVPVSYGALVADVMPGTPAQKAGIKTRDVIVGLDGKKITDDRQLRLAISELEPQTKAVLQLYRDGQKQTLTVSLAARPQDVAFNSRNDSRDNGDAADDALQGVSVADLTPRLRRQFHIPQRVQGVIITSVDANSIAQEAGLQPGDIIIEINRQPVRDATNAADLIRHSPQGRVTLRVASRDEDGNLASRFLIIQNEQ